MRRENSLIVFPVNSAAMMDRVVKFIIGGMVEAAVAVENDGTVCSACACLRFINAFMPCSMDQEIQLGNKQIFTKFFQ